MPSTTNRKTILQAIEDRKLIAIMRGTDPDDACRIAEALLSGGLSLIEVTFNQKQPETFTDTCRAIRAITSAFSGQVLTGAGTVLSKEQTLMACDAGASYIISPNVNPDVIGQTVQNGMLSLPGAMTPTEILAAHDAGADMVKLFPASVLGTGYIKAVLAPISHVRLLAVGGIHQGNVRDFLNAGCVGAGIGGNLISREAVSNKDWAAITQSARQLYSAVFDA